MVFRPTSIRLAGSTSKAWLARQFSDPYVKQRLSDPRSYRSRSAFKLLEINNQWHNFLSNPDVETVVDIGAAPGGWSQVVAGQMGWDIKHARHAKTKLVLGPNSRHLLDKHGTWSCPKAPKNVRTSESDSTFDPLNIENAPGEQASPGRGTVIAVDLLRMQPIHGVHCIQADFMSTEAEMLIQGVLHAKGKNQNKLDVILSDMAANSSGNRIHDIESSLDICRSVFAFAQRYLRSADEIGRARGGVLLIKFFVHPLLQKFGVETLHPNFKEVRIVKPDSSRSESREAYFLCFGWRGLRGI